MNGQLNKKLLDYSEYTSLIESLEKSEVDDTYKDLMKKETSVLETVNNIVQHERTKVTKRRQFLHMSIHEIYTMLFLEIPQITKELERARSVEDVMKVFFKGHRIIYIGLILVFVSIFLFFVESTR
jgi:hypothetical protein